MPEYPGYEISRAHKSKFRNTGDYTITSTIWSDLDNTLDIILDGKEGEEIYVFATGTWGTETQTAYLSVATIVSSVPVNALGSGEPTTITGDGIPSWAKPNATVHVDKISGGITYILTSADIVSNKVTLRLRCRVSGSTTLRGSSTSVFKWWAKNLGPPSIA